MSVWGLASKKRCYGSEWGSGACDVRAMGARGDGTAPHTRGNGEHGWEKHGKLTLGMVRGRGVVNG